MPSHEHLSNFCVVLIVPLHTYPKIKVVRHPIVFQCLIDLASSGIVVGAGCFIRVVSRNVIRALKLASRLTPLPWEICPGVEERRTSEERGRQGPGKQERCQVKQPEPHVVPA